MTSRRIELRSDTFTRPTEEMRRAMYGAEVGDDVWDEDPTVQRLERVAADLMGKQAGLFVSSGTQGNLVGILSHTQRGQEFIAGDESHVVWYEVGGPSIVGGLQLRTVPNRRGGMSADDVRAAIRGDDIHYPVTGCLAIENTHNRCGGAVLDPEMMQEVTDAAHGADVPVHVDGARIFNAAVALGVQAAELVSAADSVTFCLSKGLGAPVGSVLCGERDYIAQARKWRKLLGGGMRQVGVLAAAGLVALERQVHRLADDHTAARRLAEGMGSVPGIEVDLDTVQSNIVLADVTGLGATPEEFCSRLQEHNVLIAPFGPTVIRAVTSYEVDDDDIERAIEAVYQVSEGFVPAMA